MKLHRELGIGQMDAVVVGMVGKRLMCRDLIA